MQIWQMGQRCSCWAHSAQQTKWPHGRNTVFTSESMQTLHILSSFSFSFSANMCVVGTEPRPAATHTMYNYITHSMAIFQVNKSLPLPTIRSLFTMTLNHLSPHRIDCKLSLSAPGLLQASHPQCQVPSVSISVIFILNTSKTLSSRPLNWQVDWLQFERSPFSLSHAETKLKSKCP